MDGVDHARWRKSSYSGGNGGACVEVAVLPDGTMAVRDSKDPGGPKLTFPADDWAAFTTSVKAGEFDLN
jgi:hypothetical protein